jgi:predicted lactoylglutathione lyase
MKRTSTVRTPFLSFGALFLWMTFTTVVLRAGALSPEKPNLDFLLGTWFIAEMNMFETWQKNGDGYNGRAYFKKGGEEKLFETFEVKEEEGIWYYITDIQGQGVTRFALTESGVNKATFENPEHDMPNKIAYWMEGNVRKVHLSGTEGAQALSYTFELRDPAQASTMQTEGSASSLGSYCHVSIGTRQMEANIKFYKTLGFKVVSMNNEPWPWVMLSDGAVNIQLNEDGFEYFGLSYFDANMPAKIADLAAKGVVFFMDNTDPVLMKVMQDPDSIMGIALIGMDMGMAPMPLNGEGSLGTLGEIAVPVKDFEVASAWYQKVGFKTKGKQTSPYPWGIHTDGLSMIGLHQTSHFKKPTLTYFSLESKAIIARLQEAGLSVKNVMPDSKELIHGMVESPDGWPVNIFYGAL